MRIAVPASIRFATKITGECLVGLLVLATMLLAQAPTGAVAGTVTDETGAYVPAARITITHQDTGRTLELKTSIDGGFSAAALPAGAYDVQAEAAGFRVVTRRATVETGGTTTVPLVLPVGTNQQVITVQDASPQIHYDSHQIDGVVTRDQIESLPLNGRSFLQLAMLEPGVTASTSSGGRYNHAFEVGVLGGDPRSTRVTVDGGDVLDHITGGTGQNFSQEIVQEFQISTVNFDLSTGITGAGAINIVSRSGSNAFHGSGFYFFRDHNMAAYPGLQRDPTNPDPFFARRQTGANLGGPIRKDKIFFFASLEHNNQDAVFTVQPQSSDFAGFGRIAPSPFNSKQISARFDFHLTDRNTAFLRYSHDGNDGFAPLGVASLPSNWSSNVNWADQSIGGLTTALRPNVVNELRFSYTYWKNRRLQPTSADCADPCIGLGLPQIEVMGTGFTIGNTIDAPQGRDTRRYDTTDNVSWQKGSHRLHFGFEWEHYSGTGFWGFLEPGAGVLYSPDIVRLYNSQAPPAARIPLPASFKTFQDVLSLPLAGFQTGVGDPSQPPPFDLQQAKQSNRWRFYWQDTWQVRPRFSFQYGLAYSYETNLLNYDLSKPGYLGPIFGAGGLAPPRKDPNNFAPSLGFAWNVSGDNKTVIRAGAGLFYDTHLFVTRLKERSLLSPLGNGRLPIPGSAVPNPIPNIPGVPLGQPLQFTTGPTLFTGNLLMAILPSARAALAAQLGSNTNNTSLAVRNIELAKSGTDLIAPDFTTPYSEHFNIGVQREIARDLVISADFVFRQTIHQNMENIDYNRWDSLRGPVIPACVGSQALDPRAQCSQGPIEVLSTGGRSHTKALLVKVDKRLSHRTQFLASYAYSRSAGFNTTVDGAFRALNNNNWFDNFGPLEGERRHTLTISGVVSLPWGLQLGVISSMASKPPFTAWVSSIDFNGDGTNGDLLPGTQINQFNRGLGRADLQRLVESFNKTLAGTKTSRGQLIPRLTLPASFDFGDRFFSQDVRLSKTFKYGERFRFTVLGEAFNVLNVANLTGYSGNLTDPSSFGRPANRVNQVFGSGGPRAFQAGVRLSF